MAAARRLFREAGMRKAYASGRSATDPADGPLMFRLERGVVSGRVSEATALRWAASSERPSGLGECRRTAICCSRMVSRVSETWVD